MKGKKLVAKSVIKRKTKAIAIGICSKDVLRKKCLKLSEELWTLQYAIDPLSVAEKFSDYLDIIENLKNKKETQCSTTPCSTTPCSTTPCSTTPCSTTRLDVDWVRFIIDQPIVKKYIDDGDIEKFIMALEKKKVIN